jgi:hypothetical protein
MSTGLGNGDPSPYDRVMSKRRREWRRELVLALLIVVIAVSVGIYRRETGAFQGDRDWGRPAAQAVNSTPAQPAVAASQE